MRMQKSYLSFIAIFCFVISVTQTLCFNHASAKTIVTERSQSTNRLLPLTKITVGPDDQYHGSVDPQGRLLVFTHKADLVAHLQAQNLATGEVKDLLPLTADSQEASFSPTGQLAFTFFRFNARGDICLIDKSVIDIWIKPRSKGVDRADHSEAEEIEKNIHCLKRSGTRSDTERSNPFWVSKNELGYVERGIASQTRQLVAENLLTGATRELASGRIWAPAMTPGGHYLAYNEMALGESGLARRISIKDLTTGVTKPLDLDLPGISGFPTFSDDEAVIYFTHYLNDSNSDNVIDASDNAVIFRLGVAKIMAAGPSEKLLPEQLTSVESSCSFPRLFSKEIYATCAFEGSLDIYRMPQDGIVPPAWSEQLLYNALATSRSYQDRVLILNTLNVRFPLSLPLNEQMLLSNYLLDDDTAAAGYYLIKLRERASATDRVFYGLVSEFLKAREARKNEPSGQVSQEFERRIKALKLRVTKYPGEPAFKHILLGLFANFLELNREAKLELAAATNARKERGSANVRPIERYIGFQLSDLLNRPINNGNIAQRAEFYRSMLSAPELSTESKIYYGFELLNEFELVSSLPPTAEASTVKRNEQTPVRTRSEWIGLFLKENGRPVPLPPEVATLLESELHVVNLIEAKSAPEKMKVYQLIDKQMSLSRSEFFLRRALYVRAILNFANAAEFYYMGLIASNWLRYTGAADTELGYAREVFSGSSLDKAYNSLGKNQVNYAANYFYESVNLTDDLESHQGYIKAMTKIGKSGDLEKSYSYLKSHDFIDDNMKFVDAFLSIVSLGSASSKDALDPSAVNTLKHASDLLNSMVQDRNTAVRHLLLGYCQERLLFITASGVEFDQTIFEDAHRNLMLAYDLGRQNPRVKAAALQNLAFLHQRVQNHGLAVRFFALRKPLGFVSENDRKLFSAGYARSLFYNHQAGAAASELTELTSAGAPAAVQGLLLEKRALYLLVDEKFEQAAKDYALLLSSAQITGDLNLAKVKLAYGYCLLKSGQAAAAAAMLRDAVTHTKRLKDLPADQIRLTKFFPERILLIAYGLLGQVGPPADRLAALSERERALGGAKALIDEWIPTSIQNKLWIAALLTLSNPKQASEKLNETLKMARDFGRSNQFLSNTIYHALSASLSFSILHPELEPRQNFNLLSETISKTIAAYDGLKATSVPSDFQALKLKLLWATYQESKAKTDERSQMKIRISAILQSPQAFNLRKSAPSKAEELERFSQALSSKIH